MRIIALSKLRDYWIKHPRSEGPLRNWHAEASRSDWKTPADIKAAHRNAIFLANNRVVFNIQGNQHRLIVAVHYNKGRMFIRFVGTHQEYGRIDPAFI